MLVMGAEEGMGEHSDITCEQDGVIDMLGSPDFRSGPSEMVHGIRSDVQW